MMTDEQIEALTVAGETLVQFCDKEKGYYSGVFVDPVTKQRYSMWNKFDGAEKEISKKLKRPLSKEEKTILALSVGQGPTPCLTNEMRQIAFETLWARYPATHRVGSYAKMMNVMTSFY